MRKNAFAILTLTLLIAGCTQAGIIPPQDVDLDPEPRNMMLSEMAADLGWTYRTGPGAYDFTMTSPRGELVTFRAGSDLVIIHKTRWKMERDAVENTHGNDLILPESSFNFICKRFNQHHLLRGPKYNSDYRLEAIKPGDSPVAPAPAPNGPLRGLTICVDAGHGGADQGGTANGVMEKDVVLKVSLMLRDLLLASGARVLMTRTTDTYPDLDQRCELANKEKADLFVSVHANIAPNSDAVQGIEIFYKGGTVASANLARTLIGAMARVTDSPNRGAKVDPRGLRVLENTKMPAVLVELGFLSNAEEAQRLTTREYQEVMARALHDGVAQYWTKARASVNK